MSDTTRSPGAWRLLAAILVMCLFARPAFAALAQDLYAASVPVVDDSPESRPELYSAALAVVLVRVSGMRDIASRPAVQPVLQGAERFVQQFTYLPDDEIWVAFDGAALESALREVGLPVWGRERPAILVWLVVDRGDGQRRLIGSADEGEEKRIVARIAQDRGLPLIWPLLDSEDLAAASAADIWGGFGEKVRQASSRYGADAVLVARLRSGARQRLYGNWDFETGAVTERWQGGPAEGVNNVADFLVSRLASQAGAGGVVTISVTGIDTLAGYSETMSYLERLSLVERVALVEVQQGAMLFQLDLRADPGQLRRAIRLGRVLAPAPGDDGFSLAFQYLQ